MTSFANISIDFMSKTPIGFAFGESLEKTLKEFFGDGYCTLNVREFKPKRFSVEFEMFSDKMDNLDWQINLLVDYLRTRCSGKVKNFTCYVYTSNNAYDRELDENFFKKS